MKINLGWDKITENPRSGARTIDDFGIPEIKDEFLYLTPSKKLFINAGKIKFEILEMKIQMIMSRQPISGGVLRKIRLNCFF